MGESPKKDAALMSEVMRRANEPAAFPMSEAMYQAMHNRPPPPTFAPVDSSKPDDVLVLVEKELARLRLFALQIVEKYALARPQHEVGDEVLAAANKAIAVPVKGMLQLVARLGLDRQTDYYSAQRAVEEHVEGMRRCIADHNKQAQQMADQYAKAVASLNDFMDYCDPKGGVSDVPLGPFERALDVTGVKANTKLVAALEQLDPRDESTYLDGNMQPVERTPCKESPEEK